MSNSILDLPSEIMTMILRQLRRSDLGQCLFVSSAFRTLAQPLLYRYVRFDDFGVCFPYAEHKESYNGVSPSPMHKSEVTLPDIDRVEVHDHEYLRDRRCVFDGCFHITIPSCRVLSIHLESPGDDFCVAGVHFLEMGITYPNTSHPPMKYPTDCHLFQDMFQQLTAEKLVLCNVPVAYSGVDPGLLSPATFKSIREVVVLFDAESTTTEHALEVEDWVKNHRCSEGKRPCIPEFETRVTIHDLDPLFPPNATEFTFVFWTFKPGTEVTTCCCNALETRYRYSEGPAPEADHNFCCSCSCSSDDEDSEPDIHRSCWQGQFIDRVAEAIAVHAKRTTISKITIVNASAIVPEACSRSVTLRAIHAGQATHDALEGEFREALLFFLLRVGGGMEPIDAQKILDRLEFLYMRDWLAKTEWEDVFNWCVVKPWLEFEPKTSDELVT